MDNETVNNAYSNGNIDNLKTEVIALLQRLRESIEGSTSKVDAYNNTPSKKMAVNASILKSHEFKLREGLALLEATDKENWVEFKDDLVEELEAANKALLPGMN